MQIDHRCGGGTRHRRESSPIGVLAHIIANLHEYQVLCANCHAIEEHGRRITTSGARRKARDEVRAIIQGTTAIHVTGEG